MTNYLNLAAFEQTALNHEPYPYLIVPNFVNKERFNDVYRDFPTIKQPGSFPKADVDCGHHFQSLLDELEGAPLRQAIAKKFNMDLTHRPILTTVRGYVNTRDGKIHTDSKDKLITVLLYLNQDWEKDTGRLRLLHNNHDLDNYAAEIPPTAGTALIFKVTDNCWHGHKTFIGERKAIQMNYITDKAALNKHMKRHNFSAKIKGFIKSIGIVG